ncbi:MAG TPA: UDP-N-acetylglucosamine 2-epimerase (non-hydrolyzing) [Desulfatiglandales bacterium]|nr:UDP-N-acetylglucosamine 2-epimerase (non-hydrolyzing) [Desulfatiglandales bacterium]
MKIVTVIGARPQFIKAAAVNRALKKHNKKLQNKVGKDDSSHELFTEVIIHTGQHFDVNMSDVFFEEMQIYKPDYYLGICSLAHGAMTGRMLEKIEAILFKEKPDIVLVYGDTNSTLAGALAAKKLNIEVAHIEAGLRNHDFTIPEEVNRVLTDRISDILFVSTDVAFKNLQKEGFASFQCDIVKTGDLMADNILFYSQEAASKSMVLRKLGIDNEKYILCTVHRASNTTLEKLSEIIKALNKISEEHKIVFPVHPRTQQVIEENNLFLCPRILFINPVGYLDMIQLLANSWVVITDSGGLQKEAYLMKKNSLLLMEYTPWEELVDNGFSQTTEINEEAILKNFEIVSKANPDYSLNLYGDGDAAKQIVTALHDYLLGRKGKVDVQYK